MKKAIAEQERLNKEEERIRKEEEEAKARVQTQEPELMNMDNDTYK